MQKKKRNFRILLIILLGICIIEFIRLREVNVYVGNSTPSIFDTGIDVNVKIDGKAIISDSIYYQPFHYINIKKKMRLGYHSIEVTSNKAEVNQKGFVFLLPCTYIYLEFFPHEFINDKRELHPRFSIESMFEPFYYE